MPKPEATMAVRQRAVDREGKEARREALLDAAERLFDADPARAPSVSEVADAAGLAKGTVYLYFASKERLMLALHERQVEGFFGALAAYLDQALQPRIGDVPERALEWLAEHPVFMALAAHGHRARGGVGSAPVTETSRGRSASLAAVAAERLARCGGGHDPASALALLWQSLALVVGLAQLGRPEDIASGMRTLWCGFGERAAGGEPRPLQQAQGLGAHADEGAR